MMYTGNNQAAYRSENNRDHYLVQESYLFMYYDYQVIQLLDRLCRICGHRQTTVEMGWRCVAFDSGLLQPLGRPVLFWEHQQPYK